MTTLLHSEKVLSSNGKDHYTVNVWDDYTADCECLGFYHRHYCRHIQGVLLVLIERVKTHNKLEPYNSEENWKPK